jgi:hypothetical protein
MRQENVTQGVDGRGDRRGLEGETATPRKGKTGIRQAEGTLQNASFTAQYGQGEVRGSNLTDKLGSCAVSHDGGHCREMRLDRRGAVGS